MQQTTVDYFDQYSIVNGLWLICERPNANCRSMVVVYVMQWSYTCIDATCCILIIMAYMYLYSIWLGSHSRVAWGISSGWYYDHSTSDVAVCSLDGMLHLTQLPKITSGSSHCALMQFWRDQFPCCSDNSLSQLVQGAIPHSAHSKIGSRCRWDASFYWSDVYSYRRQSSGIISSLTQPSPNYLLWYITTNPVKYISYTRILIISTMCQECIRGRTRGEFPRSSPYALLHVHVGTVASSCS